MGFTKILFHTQFREFAFNALRSVLELKQLDLKEVVLVYVVPREEVAFVPYGGYLKDHEERIQAEARIRFKDWQQSISALGIESAIRIETGQVNSVILNLAQEENVDLIVTGRKKRTPMEKVYIGTHILDILRRSTIPVLMSKYMVQFESGGMLLTRENDHIFKRPLLATDWSPPSQNALKRLTSLTGLAQRLLITHIIGSKLSKGIGASALKMLEDESKRRLMAACQIAENGGLPSEFHLSIGKTVSEILRISRENNATMIVMGRTGKDWIEEYWLGGVSHRIAELSELPVLLVP